MTEYIKHKVADAISLTVTDTGKTMAQRIADETCKLLEAKIDEVINKITDGTLDKLRQKIDSEEFSEKFVNVLQQKLIDGQPPDDPFLNKFIKLFDTVIEKAINNYGKPINIPPKDIVAGINDYLQNSVPDFWESNGQKLYTEAVANVLVDFNNYQDLCPSVADQDQMDVAYVVNEIKDLQNQIERAVNSDPLASQREAYVNKVVTGLHALPGVNTRESVLAALDA